MKYILTIIIILSIFSRVNAQVSSIPQNMAFQGFLSVADTAYTSPPAGVPATMILYKDAAGTNQVWSHTYDSVQVVNGYYTVLMDFTHDWQNGNANFNKQFWLSANINGQLMKPPVKLAASPYAFNARLADDALHAHVADTALNTPQSPVGTIIAFGGTSLAMGKMRDRGWYLCDGSPINASAYPLYATVVGTTYGSNSGDTILYLPDFRGLFLRGVNSGYINGARADSLADPDANSRFEMIPGKGGNTGNKVGSIQSDVLKRHKHRVRVDYGNSGAGSGWVVNNSGSGRWDTNNPAEATMDSYPIDSSSGSETRPKNAYVYWLIKVDDR